MSLIVEVGLASNRAQRRLRVCVRMGMLERQLEILSFEWLQLTPLFLNNFHEN